MGSILFFMFWGVRAFASLQLAQLCANEEDHFFKIRIIFCVDNHLSCKKTGHI